MPTFVVPVWTSDFKVLDDRGLGVATYALRLRLPTEQSVWFETYGFQTAGRLFVADLDGNVLAVGESGEVGRSADSELAINWYPNELGFERDRASSDDVILVAQISNFSYPNGGFQKPLYIQTFSRGKRASLFKIVLTSLTLGITVSFAHHLLLYFQRREDPLPAYFAGFCLSFAIREAVMSGLAERFGWRNAWTSYESFVTLEYSRCLSLEASQPLYRTFSIDGVVSTICPLLAWVLRGALGSHGADDIGLDLWQVSLGLSDLSLGRDPSYLGPSHHRSCPSYTVCVGNFGSLLLLGGGGRQRYPSRPAAYRYRLYRPLYLYCLRIGSSWPDCSKVCVRL